MTTDRLPAARFTWERALRGAGLSKCGYTVGLAMATYANADGTSVRPGQSELAGTTPYSLRSVQRAIQELEESGYLALVRRGRSYGRGGGGFTSEYRLSLPTEALLPQNNPPSTACSSEESYPQGDALPAQNNPPSVQNNPPSVQNNPPSTTEQPATPGVPPDQRPDQLPRHLNQSAAGHQGRAALAEAVDNRNSKPADEMYAAANRKLSTRPDLGRALMDAAREALGPDASERALVVHAAQQTGWTWTREEVAV